MTGQTDKEELLPGSFRDPSGFLFRRDGVLYRQINREYRPHYERLVSSGLYEELAGAGLLVAHEEVAVPPRSSINAWKVIKPSLLPFISYPYEWCFSQLRDAALITLEIQGRALNKGMILKDCSAYNVQFIGGRPVFIDSLSFEIYEEGKPWVAYRQFCQHFLAPLALMAYADIRLGRLLRLFIDGIPLDLASRLLPFKSRTRFPLLTHVHLHAKSQLRHAGLGVKAEPSGRMSLLSLRGMVDSLRSGILGLKWEPRGTEWAEYYADTNYSATAMESKKNIVSKYLDRIRPNSAWDLGGNIGEFSRLAAIRGCQTVCFDVDPAAVEKCYRDLEGDHLLPLVMDLTNPSPGIGWSNSERESLSRRGPVDVVLALALVHHLAISNNVPFNRIAEYFSSLGSWLIVEFIPKEDSQVQRLLANRKDIFSDYAQEQFEEAFGKVFALVERIPISGSSRSLYLMGPANPSI